MRKCIFVVLLFAAVQSSAQKLDSAAIHRIGDYGKLWYMLCLFHPQMAYGKINEDSLFTNHINNLIADPSAANFRQAVNGMLDELGDRGTTINSNNQTQLDSVVLPDRPLVKWLKDSTALVYLSPDFMSTSVQGNYSSPDYKQLIDTLRQAHRIVIDMRNKSAITDEDEQYYGPSFMKSLIGILADHPVSYPAMRTRIHYGHEDDNGNVSFYFQGWLLQNGARINAPKTTIHKPVCLLVNRFDDYVASEIATMQKEGIAHVVADDSLGNFVSSSTYAAQLADSLVVNMRLAEIVYQDGSRFFEPDSLISSSASGKEEALVKAAMQQLQQPKQRATSDNILQNVFVSNKAESFDSLSYPPASLRLLGLARYWSIINYFCPNKDRFSKNWNDVLYQYVPLFLQATDSIAYNLTAAHLIKEINDSHGFFGSRVMRPFFAGTPELEVSFVEGKTIVTKLFNDSLKKAISIGDEIISVNGMPVNKARDSVAQWIGASNNASLQRDVSSILLTGKMDSKTNIGYRHHDKPASITLQRKPRVYSWQRQDTSAVFKKLSDKLGYADFGRLEVSQLDSMFALFRNTDAFILDDRSYPRGTVWSMINYLTSQTVTGARGTTMIADSPDTATITRQDNLWQIPVHPKPELYKGKIIILVNEETQSQAEYSCMVLQAASKNVTIIGSKTAGADGDVTYIKLPGGISTAFSGHGVHYPDGRATQGIGIVPDIAIQPTIASIKAGRDEVLERAILFAKTGK